MSVADFDLSESGRERDRIRVVRGKYQIRVVKGPICEQIQSARNRESHVLAEVGKRQITQKLCQVGSDCSKVEQVGSGRQCSLVARKEGECICGLERMQVTGNQNAKDLEL